MRVIVTGADGYIGRVLARRLVALGHEVVGLDVGLYRGCSFTETAPSWTARSDDVRDVTAREFAGAEAVCHLAALSNDPLGAIDPRLTREINYDGTIRVARAAKEAGVRRFLFASSCSVYGRQPDGVAATEASPLEPRSEYARSKVDAERALHELADRRFTPVYLRQATAFGWSERFRFDLVLNNFVGWALTTGGVRLLSDGSAWRPIAHVADLAEAFACALAAPRDAIHDLALNVGSDGENHRIRDLARAAADAVGVPDVSTTAGAVADDRSYRVSFARIRERLPSWSATRTATFGAREMRDALRAAGCTTDDFNDERFTRLRRLVQRRARGELDERLRPSGVAAT